MKTACLLAFGWMTVAQMAPAEVVNPAARQKAREALEAALDGQPKIPENFEEPTDGYFYGYQLFSRSENARDRETAARYRQSALEYFRKVKVRFPEWKPAMVNRRIEFTLEAIAAAEIKPPGK